MGSGHDYLRNKFFSGCEGQRATVKCQVYIDCCRRWFDFTITYEGVELCEDDCSISVDLQRVTVETKAYRYLADTIYWKNGFIDAFIHPKVFYCNQPGFLQFVLLAMFPVLAQIIIAINIIVAVVKFLCEVVTLTLGNCDLGGAEDLSVCTIYEIIGGCGRYAPSPLIREILEYNATAAGLTLESSIFQTEPYSNAALFQLQYERGNNSGNWSKENAGNLTTIQLLDRLKEVYLLDYRISGGKLIVEREDFFDSRATEVGAVTGCISFKQGDACAYGDYKYTDDPVENQGNRLRSNYDDIIEFNPEAAKWKSGSCDVTAKFGRARYMFDQRGQDRPDDVPGGDNATFLGDNFIDRYRTGNAFSIFGLNVLNVFGCRDDRRERDLILQDDRASLFKILVLEQGFNREDAFTIRKEIGSDNGLTFYAYNYPMYYREDEPEGLYNRFHIINNPNTSKRAIYGLSSAELPFSCDLIETIEGAELGYKVQTSQGEGLAETVDVNFGKKTVTANNIKIKC